MTYGNADFMGLPWEIIIKAYARKLGDGKFDKLEQYARDFLAFVETNDAFFPDAVVERSLDLIRWGLISTLVQRHELSLHSADRASVSLGADAGDDRSQPPAPSQLGVGSTVPGVRTVAIFSRMEDRAQAARVDRCRPWPYWCSSPSR
jgi:hypothetical protein